MNTIYGQYIDETYKNEVSGEKALNEGVGAEVGKALLDALGKAIGNFLKGVGFIILASLAFIALIFLSYASTQATKESILQAIKSNRKCKSLFKLIFENSQKFIMLNISPKYKKYLIPFKVDEIDRVMKDKWRSNNAVNKYKDKQQIAFLMIDIDTDKILYDNYKVHIKDVVKQDREANDGYLSDDYYIDFAERYEKVIEVQEAIIEEIESISDKVADIKNCQINFRSQIGECGYDGRGTDSNGYIELVLRVKNFASFDLSPEEKEAIEKLSGTKIDNEKEEDNK